MTDASQLVTQRDVCNNVKIALENVACANARTLLHPNMQQEMRNANLQAHKDQRE